MRKLWLVAFLSLNLGNLTWADPIELPDIGDRASRSMGPGEEARLGDQLIRSLRRSMAFIGDPEINEYFSNLGYRLVSQLDKPKQDYTFFLIKDVRINAFALPGGYIVFNSGLIRTTKGESELAAVLGHEIAHVSQRHLARLFEKANVTNLKTLAGLILAMAVSGSNPELAQATFAATIAGTIQSQINFTRENEKEADRVGIDLLARSGYDTHSMPKFFERLHRATRLYGEQPPEFLSTHPVTTNRMADSKNRAAQYKKKGKKNIDAQSYYLVKAKLRVLEETPENNIKFFREQMKAKLSHHEKVAAKYGYALALLRDNKTKEAQPILTKLVQQDPNRIMFKTALAKLELEQGNVSTAVKTYKKALQLNPNNYPLTLFLAEALLHNGDAKQSVAIIRDQLRSKPNTPQLYELLARAEGELARTEGKPGSLAAAHRALAEYFFLVGHTFAAIEQLKIAKKTTNLDEYQRLKIEARLKQLQTVALDEGR